LIRGKVLPFPMSAISRELGDSGDLCFQFRKGGSQPSALPHPLAPQHGIHRLTSVRARLQSCRKAPEKILPHCRRPSRSARAATSKGIFGNLFPPPMSAERAVQTVQVTLSL
jgi:hypothetical protein